MEKQSPVTDLYMLINGKAVEIEAELKRLNRWQSEPLPAERYENMGAFGSNTMAFEQWIQFILIPRIQEIMTDHGEFPSGSMLGTYAVRVFDGDNDAGRLQELLYDIDQLINSSGEYPQPSREVHEMQGKSDTVTIGDTTIPAVLYTLAELLPQFEGDDLESQLQTFDTFLNILAPSVRPSICNLLQKAAGETSNAISRLRIEAAAHSIGRGGQAAAPYDHDKAMRKYSAEHKKNFPS